MKKYFGLVAGMVVFALGKRHAGHVSGGRAVHGHNGDEIRKET